MGSLSGSSPKAKHEVLLGCIILLFLFLITGGLFGALGYWWNGAVGALVFAAAAVVLGFGLLVWIGARADPPEGEGARDEAGKEQGPWLWRYRGGRPRRQTHFEHGIPDGLETTWLGCLVMLALLLTSGFFMVIEIIQTLFR